MEKTNTHLFYSYNIIISLLEHFSLIIKHGKTKVFHFSRSQGLFDPPLLDLSSIGVGDLILHPKNSWKYLRYIFDRKLTFCQHIGFYTNKVPSMVKCIKMLGNLTSELLPHQKCLLYRTCILSTALYSFLL